MKHSSVPKSLLAATVLLILSTMSSVVDAKLMAFMDPFEKVDYSVAGNVEQHGHEMKKLLNNRRLQATRRQIDEKRGRHQVDATTREANDNEAEFHHRGLSSKKSGMTMEGAKDSRKYSTSSVKSGKGSSKGKGGKSSSSKGKGGKGSSSKSSKKSTKRSGMSSKGDLATPPPTASPTMMTPSPTMMMTSAPTTPIIMSSEDAAPPVSEDQGPISGDTASMSEDTAPVSEDQAPLSEDYNASPISGDVAPVSEDQAPLSEDFHSAPVSEDAAPVSEDYRAPPIVSEDDGSPISGDTVPVVSEDEEGPMSEDVASSDVSEGEDDTGSDTTDTPEDENEDEGDTQGEDQDDTGSDATDTPEDENEDEGDSQGGDQDDTEDEDPAQGDIVDEDVNEEEEEPAEQVEILTDMWEFVMVRTEAGTADSQEDFNLTSLIAMKGVVYEYAPDRTSVNMDEAVGDFSATCVVVSMDHDVLCTYKVHLATADTFGLGEFIARGHVRDHQNENLALVTGTAFDWAPYTKGGTLVMQPNPDDPLTLNCSLTLRYPKDVATN